MKSTKAIKKFFCMAIVMIFLIQTTACGTLIYPERRGQKAGKIDIQVAILNSLGLLLFIVPGVIAFAVDFATGAIFLPGAKKSSSSDHVIRVVKINPADLNEKTISEIVAKETGLPESKVISQAIIYKIDEDDDVKTKLLEIQMAGYSSK